MSFGTRIFLYDGEHGMYIAKRTALIASKGSDATPYALVDGKEVTGMDSITLRNALERGWIEKVSAAITTAPEKKFADQLKSIGIVAGESKSATKEKKESFRNKALRTLGFNSSNQ